MTIGEKRHQYRTGLSSKYNKDNWGFIAKEQGACQWMKNYEEEGSGVRGEILAKQTTGFLLKSAQGGEISDQEFDPIWRVEDSF